MVASLAEALNRARDNADPKTRMEIALKEMHALATKKFQRAHDNTVGVVSNEMLEVLWDNPRYIKAFVLEWAQWTNLLKAQMDRFCASVQRDMKNAPQGVAGVHRENESQFEFGARDSIPAQAGEGDGVQSLRESHTVVGPAPSIQNEGEAIQKLAESQTVSGPSSSSPVSSGEVQRGFESHCRAGLSAAPSNRNDVVQRSNERQIAVGRVVPIANSPRSLADMQRTRQIVKPSIFETCSIRGEPLSKMCIGRLRRLRFENLFESALATLIINYKVTTDDMLVPDVITGDQLSRMIVEAQDIANAA